MAAPPRPLDRVSGAQVVIELEHHEIHDGNHFTSHYESAAPLPTLVGEETAIGFLTPSLPTRIHMIVDVRADDESTFEIREDPTVVLGNGLAINPLNRERSGGQSTMYDLDTPANLNSITTYTVVQANAADLSGGTILHSETLAIAAGPPFASVLNAVSRGQREWVLVPDTEYVVILTNLTANNTVHEIVLNWYEMIDNKYRS